MTRIDRCSKGSGVVRARRPRARTGSIMVRKDRNSDTALSGRLGSWAGERAAQRPRVWKIGSLS